MRPIFILSIVLVFHIYFIHSFSVLIPILIHGITYWKPANASLIPTVLFNLLPSTAYSFPSKAQLFPVDSFNSQPLPQWTPTNRIPTPPPLLTMQTHSNHPLPSFQGHIPFVTQLQSPTIFNGAGWAVR